MIVKVMKQTVYQDLAQYAESLGDKKFQIEI